MAEIPTSELVERAFTETHELVSAEIALAKQEARTEATAALTAIVATAAWIALGLFAAMSLVATLVVALGGTPLAAFAVMAATTAALAVAGFVVARRWMPRNAFEKTQERLQEDVRALKDRLS